MKTPTRSLLGRKPLHYVNAINTDIRRTFRRFRLLARMQAQRVAAPMVNAAAGA
jgi:hypothetical protein